MSFTFGVTFFLIAGAVLCASSKIPCPAPVAPEHGEAFLYKGGRVVKYGCEPGYTLKGKEVVGCIDGKWEEDNPACLEIEDKSKSIDETSDKVVENGTDVQLINSTTTAMLEEDEGYQSDDALRQLYWYAHYYHNGAPGVMALTESQLRWIDSLHPELRDRYLRGMYIVRAEDTAAPERVASLIARDAYDYIYRVPYLRRAASTSVEVSHFPYDYSCSQHAYFIYVENPPNTILVRYETRQNPINPDKYFLVAIFKCKSGYKLRDDRYKELFCSNYKWVGVRPICDRID